MSLKITILNLLPYLSGTNPNKSRIIQASGLTATRHLHKWRNVGVLKLYTCKNLKTRGNSTLPKIVHCQNWAFRNPPSRPSYGVSIVIILEKINCVITAPRCVTQSLLYHIQHRITMTEVEHSSNLKQTKTTPYWAMFKVIRVSMMKFDRMIRH